MVLAERGTPEWGGCGGCSSPVLAQRAHQTNHIFRMAVLVEARSRRRISLHP
jgi:hypothetical protein